MNYDHYKFYVLSPPIRKEKFEQGAYKQQLLKALDPLSQNMLFMHVLYQICSKNGKGKNVKRYEKMAKENKKNPKKYNSKKMKNIYPKK